MIIVLYLLCIVTANVLTASFQPLNMWGLIVPMGTFFIGLNFLLRDFLQMKYGKRNTYLFIVLALMLSGVTSYLLGDMLHIVYASAFSFLVSELTDTEIFTRLKDRKYARFIASGAVAGLLDSIIFAVVGLLPLGFITVASIPSAVAGQIVVKFIMQLPVFLLAKNL